jgi:hypothetical protein
MLNQLLAVIAPILICAGLGFAWARRGHEYPVDFVTRAVMNIGAPCLIISALRYGREPGEVAGMVVMSTLISFALLPLIVAFVLS